MKKSLLFLLLLSIISTAKAYRIESGNDVVIDKPFYGNFYAAAGNITINAPVYGDVVIAGGNITINDSVTEDVLLAGGKAIINGHIGGDIRAANGQLNILKGVGGEAIVTGGRIEIGKNATINKGLMIAGGDILINGVLKGKATGYGGTMVLNGIAENAVDFRGGKIEINGTIMGPSVLAARDIVIGNNASFNSDIRYWNRKGSLDTKQSPNNAKFIYDSSLKVDSGNWYFLGFATALGVLWYVGMALLMIALVQYLFSKTMGKAADTAFSRTGKSVGYGLLFLIGVPIAIVILMITVIGLPVGLMLLFAYITLMLLSTVIASVVFANWINSRYNHNWSNKRLVLTALGMFILFKIISSTPFFGALIMLILVSTAFGAILLNINWRRQQPENVVKHDTMEYVG